MFDLIDRTIDLPCKECGKEEPIKLINLVYVSMICCDSCNHTYQVDMTEAIGGIAEILDTLITRVEGIK